MKKFVVINIDDDEVTLMLHKILVKASGYNYEVENHTSGEGALEFIKSLQGIENYVVIMLLDINMPSMSGWDVLEEMRKVEKLNAFVALVTSSIDSRDQEKAKHYPFVTDFFVKPINKNQLINFFHKVNTLNK